MDASTLLSRLQFAFTAGFHYLGGFGLSAADFMHAMIELGVSAAVILALGITLKLLVGFFEQEE
jgi:hypothetical protein